MSNQQENNKTAVIEFFELAFNKKDFAAALPYLGPYYIQHHPGAADGIEGLKHYVSVLKQNFSEAHFNIKRVFAEGDYVFLHIHLVKTPHSRGIALMDLFRLENGKIIEHWGVSQEVSEKPANSNGMF